jgi:hypothetical protein
MHRLFGDYLKMRLDLTASVETPSKRAKLSAGGIKDLSGLLGPYTLDEFLSIKLYTMEEMWLWLQSEYSFSHLRARRIGFSDREKMASLPASYVGWLSTIKMHLEAERAKTSENFRAYSDAYTPEFVDFCRQIWNEPPATMAKSTGTAGTGPSSKNSLETPPNGTNDQS